MLLLGTAAVILCELPGPDVLRTASGKIEDRGLEVLSDKDIADVLSSAGDVRIKHDGTVKISDIDEDDLPLEVTIVFDEEYAG